MSILEMRKLRFREITYKVPVHTLSNWQNQNIDSKSNVLNC